MKPGFPRVPQPQPARSRILLRCSRRPRHTRHTRMAPPIQASCFPQLLSCSAQMLSCSAVQLLVWYGEATAAAAATAAATESSVARTSDKREATSVADHHRQICQIFNVPLIGVLLVGLVARFPLLENGLRPTSRQPCGRRHLAISPEHYPASVSRRAITASA